MSPDIWKEISGVFGAFVYENECEEVKFMTLIDI